MGQEGNSGLNANLDEKHSRVAGRRNQQSPERQAIKDSQSPVYARGKTAGAFGKSGRGASKGSRRSK